MKFREERLSITSLDPDRDRSPGIHFSHILKPLLVGMDAKRYGKKLQPNLLLMGFVWEEVLSAGLGRLVREKAPDVKQCEIEVEMAGHPVLMTPDGFNWGKWRVFESKATRISSRRELDDHMFWGWHVQMKAYCRATQTNEADLMVMFLNGNYSRGEGEESGPQIKLYSIRYSDEELAENWAMLESKLADMLAKGELDEVLKVTK